MTEKGNAQWHWTCKPQPNYIVCDWPDHNSRPSGVLWSRVSAFPGALYSETPQDANILNCRHIMESGVDSITLVVVTVKYIYHRANWYLCKCRHMLQPEKLQAMPMVKRANTHGRPCEILECFWKDDPVGRWVPGPICAFPLSVFYLLYCIWPLHYHIRRKAQYRGAELPYRCLSYNTIDRGSI